MLIIENIRLALTAIKSNKMRSFLTMLGIIIGISSVIAITSIGSSAKSVMDDEFSTFGKNAMYIYVNWNKMENDWVEESDLLMMEDIEALKTRFGEDIIYIAPSVSAKSEVKVGRVEGNLQMNGVGADYNNYFKMDLVYGRMINKKDVEGSRDRIVINTDAARHFFNKENAVGETFSVSINGDLKDLSVVGVYKKEKSIFDSMMPSEDYPTYIPYSIVQQPGASLQYIELYVDPNKDPAALGLEITNYLSKIKGKQEGLYAFESAKAQLDMINGLLGTLSLAIGAIAAISLVVGGIGIMNIMLVSVTERTKEIGIRKSLGARTKDILMQFLIEAMILSAIGGLIGTVLGVSIAAIGMSFADISVSIQPAVIFIAVGFSAIVGMFFGLYPARKAAKLDPIEALRYE
ncbi:MAG: ABC transporter permease [Eubacteriales bacterium]|nr:ABC transporter permease [Eubacteriales bacterium]MDD3350679.1 ABC transporter permease [Eubacteriales bacterium]